MNNMETILKMLTCWEQHARGDMFTLPGTDALMTYGTGYGGWAVQTTQKAAGALAMLGAVKSDHALIKKAQSMLRFNLESHLTGSRTCLDGQKWGHTWISALGIERMMHGIDAIWSFLTEGDRALLERVLVSECDWICDDYEIKAAPLSDTLCNRPESNAWNGSLLFRTAVMFPQTPRAQIYLESADAYLSNAVSFPEDLGRNPKCVGHNFFETSALNHHGYLNIGYMVITLSQLAMLYFFCRERGIAPPKSLYQHVPQLWQLVKSCITPDGRLIRIGGDTRIRYCYCQDYAIPVWLFIQDYLGDPDCAQFLSGWLGIVRSEMEQNKDGSFLSCRCGKMRSYSPIYYTRLESDRAVSLSMALSWVPNRSSKAPVPPLRAWHDDFHGSTLVRSKGGIVSWTWRGASGPVGLCLPESDSSLAEWDKNLAGEIRGLGLTHRYELISHHEIMFEGGFLTMGTMDIIGQLFEAEQQTTDHLAREKIVFVLLPDSQTAIVLQYAFVQAQKRSYVSLIKGLKLNVPNDLFSKGTRTYFHEHGTLRCESLCAEAASPLGKWVNIEGKLGVCLSYGRENLTLYSPGRRQAMVERPPHLYTGHDTGSLCSDEIITAFDTNLQEIWGERTLIDTGAVIQLHATPTETRAASVLENRITLRTDQNSRLRYAEATGTDGNRYCVLTNFGDLPADVQMDSGAYVLYELDGIPLRQALQLAGNTARVFRIGTARREKQ